MPLVVITTMIVSHPDIDCDISLTPRPLLVHSMEPSKDWISHICEYSFLRCHFTDYNDDDGNAGRGSNNNGNGLRNNGRFDE
jgi:hypothetical protein